MNYTVRCLIYAPPQHEIPSLGRRLLFPEVDLEALINRNFPSSVTLPETYLCFSFFLSPKIKTS